MPLPQIQELTNEKLKLELRKNKLTKQIHQQQKLLSTLENLSWFSRINQPNSPSTGIIAETKRVYEAHAVKLDEFKLALDKLNQRLDSIHSRTQATASLENNNATEPCNISSYKGHFFNSDSFMQINKEVAVTIGKALLEEEINPSSIKFSC